MIPYDEVSYRTTCDRCGSPMQCTAGQALERGTLRWGVECICSNCENAVYERGDGALPKWLRSAIIAESGLWSLQVLDASSRVALLKVVRERFGVTLVEARGMADRLLSSGWSGTKAEVLHLCNILSEAGIRSKTEMREGGSA